MEESTSEENKEAPFVYVESLSKSYTVEEFLSLSDEEKKELSVALSSREFAGLYDKTKYMYNEEMDKQILDIIVLSSKQ